jgi:hypothetical protein
MVSAVTLGGPGSSSWWGAAKVVRTACEEIPMKTLTCRELDGPCDLALSAATGDEIIKALDRHLREAVRSGDTAHEPAHEEMKGRWRHPVKAMGWYRKTKKTFADHPED